MKSLLMSIIPALLFASCNVAFFVSKDDVIRKEQGYIFIASNNKEVAFIPSKIDTNLSLTENLAKHKLGNAFYINGLFPSQINYLKIFGDTIFLSAILVPVEIKYTETKEVNRQLRREKKDYSKHFIKIDDKIYSYQIKIRNIYYISGYPIISEQKKRQKTKDYEEL